MFDEFAGVEVMQISPWQGTGFGPLIERRHMGVDGREEASVELSCNGRLCIM